MEYRPSRTSAHISAAFVGPDGSKRIILEASGFQSRVTVPVTAWRGRSPSRLQPLQVTARRPSNVSSHADIVCNLMGQRFPPVRAEPASRLSSSGQEAFHPTPVATHPPFVMIAFIQEE